MQKEIRDASEAKEKLGWKPKVGLRELIKIMINADLRKENIDKIK